MITSNTTINQLVNIQKNSIMFLISLVEDIMDLSRFSFDAFDLNYDWLSYDEVIDEVF